MKPALSRRRGLTVAGLTAGTVVLVLGGSAVPRTAQAASAPMAQETCPAQGDPATYTRPGLAYAVIDGMPGGDRINLSGVRTGLLGAANAACGATGKAAADPIVIDKTLDRASVSLAVAAAKGDVIPSIRINFASAATAGNPNPPPFFTYDVRNAHVLSIRQVKQGDSVAEEVTFDYSTIAYGYQGTDGALRFCYDVATNTGTSC